jgi:hypothetical protein
MSTPRPWLWHGDCHRDHDRDRDRHYDRDRDAIWTDGQDN